MNTDVRGSVKIKSANPDVYPEIKVQLFIDETRKKRVDRGYPLFTKAH